MSTLLPSLTALQWSLAKAMQAQHFMAYSHFQKLLLHFSCIYAAISGFSIHMGVSWGCNFHHILIEGIEIINAIYLLLITFFKDFQ